MDDIEAKIRQEFIAEASEMLETVESAFMELERNPDDVKVIDKIFRLAHTIKGSALSVGFTRLGEFAHVVETLLVRVREKKLALTPEISDLLLRSNDRLGQYVNALRNDAAAVVETGDVERMIQEVLGRSQGTPLVATPVAGPAPTAAPAFGFFDDEPAKAPAAPVAAFGFFDDPAPAPVPVQAAPKPNAEALLMIYAEIARIAARGGVLRSALAPVLTQLERTLEEAG